MLDETIVIGLLTVFIMLSILNALDNFFSKR